MASLTYRDAKLTGINASQAVNKRSVCKISNDPRAPHRSSEESSDFFLGNKNLLKYTA